MPCIINTGNKQWRLLCGPDFCVDLDMDFLWHSESRDDKECGLKLYKCCCSIWEKKSLFSHDNKNKIIKQNRDTVNRIIEEQKLKKR